MASEGSVAYSMTPIRVLFAEMVKALMRFVRKSSWSAKSTAVTSFQVSSAITTSIG